MHQLSEDFPNWFPGKVFAKYLHRSRAAIKTLCIRTVFLKLGGIAPLGAILMNKGAKKSKGAIKHQGGENAQPLIDH